MRSQLLKLNWLIILISHFVFSQQIAEFEDIKERYEDDKLVELEKITHIVIEVEGDQLKIGRTSSSSTLYLNENAKQYAKEGGYGWTAKTKHSRKLWYRTEQHPDDPGKFSCRCCP